MVQICLRPMLSNTKSQRKRIVSWSRLSAETDSIGVKGKILHIHKLWMKYKKMWWHQVSAKMVSMSFCTGSMWKYSVTKQKWNIYRHYCAMSRNEMTPVVHNVGTESLSCCCFRILPMITCLSDASERLDIALCNASNYAANCSYVTTFCTIWNHC